MQHCIHTYMHEHTFWDVEMETGEQGRSKQGKLALQLPHKSKASVLLRASGIGVPACVHAVGQWLHELVQSFILQPPPYAEIQAVQHSASCTGGQLMQVRRGVRFHLCSPLLRALGVG